LAEVYRVAEAAWNGGVAAGGAVLLVGKEESASQMSEEEEKNEKMELHVGIVEGNKRRNSKKQANAAFCLE
jgi:hypothetical protein